MGVFFYLFILACDLYRSWRRTFCPIFLSAVCAVTVRDGDAVSRVRQVDLAVIVVPAVTYVARQFDVVDPDVGRPLDRDVASAFLIASLRMMTS